MLLPILISEQARLNADINSVLVKDALITLMVRLLI